MGLNRDEIQRNVDAVKRLQQFIETISATFRLMAADISRLSQDLEQPLHEMARIEQERQEALWAQESSWRNPQPSPRAMKKKKRRRLKAR